MGFIVNTKMWSGKPWGKAFFGSMFGVFLWGGSVVARRKAFACNAGDLGSFPGSGRSSGEGNGNPLQYSCLENPLDREAWQATVHGIAKSQTRLSDFTFGAFLWGPWFLQIEYPCLLQWCLDLSGFRVCSQMNLECEAFLNHPYKK